MTIPTPKRYVVECACCGRRGIHKGRGLVSACYKRIKEHGRLGEFPRLTYLYREEVLDAWYRAVIRPPLGLTTAEVARSIGLTHEALEKVLIRARRDGDERAIYIPHPHTGRRYREPVRRISDDGEE